MSPTKRATKPKAKPAEREGLADFEGLPVTEVGIEIRNAAGGLNEALAVDAQEWHRGEEAVVVLRCKLAKIRHDPAKKQDDAWRRVHVFDAEEATVVEADFAAERLEEQRVRIEEARGIQRLDFPPGTEHLVAEHEAGGHAGELTDACPLCEAERAAEEDGS